jgi:hypothetical protein
MKIACVFIPLMAHRMTREAALRDYNPKLAGVTAAKLVIDDGAQNIQTTHHIEYTDFPLAQITLFACRDERIWIVMLPGEY